jgi:hypothetical protein
MCVCVTFSVSLFLFVLVRNFLCTWCHIYIQLLCVCVCVCVTSFCVIHFSGLSDCTRFYVILLKTTNMFLHSIVWDECVSNCKNILTCWINSCVGWCQPCTVFILHIYLRCSILVFVCYNPYVTHTQMTAACFSIPTQWIFVANLVSASFTFKCHKVFVFLFLCGRVWEA